MCSCTHRAGQYGPAPFPGELVNRNYFLEKLDGYRPLRIAPDDIVMFGDDLMDRGMWNEFFGSDDIKNRGIALEPLDGALYRVDSILMHRPRKLFISSSLIDIKHGNRPAGLLADGLLELVKRAGSRCASCRLYMIGPVPDATLRTRPDRKRCLDSLHALLRFKADSCKLFTYLDPRPVLCDSTGFLSSDYSYDGVLLNGTGYYALSKYLSAYMELKVLSSPREADIVKQHVYYRNRYSIFNSLPRTPGAVIMLGNSLTNNARWNEWLSGYKVLNRGISGDTIGGLALRIDQVIAQRPATIFLMIGANDFIENPRTRPDDAYSAFSEIAGRLRRELPRCRLFVQSILPLNPISPYYENRNDSIAKYNALLESSAREHGYTYINLSAVLQDSRGDLDARFTYDGIHLRASAYVRWKNLITDALNRQSEETL